MSRLTDLVDSLRFIKYIRSISFSKIRLCSRFFFFAPVPVKVFSFVRWTEGPVTVGLRPTDVWAQCECVKVNCLWRGYLPNEVFHPFHSFISLPQEDMTYLSSQSIRWPGSLSCSSCIIDRKCPVLRIQPTVLEGTLGEKWPGSSRNKVIVRSCRQEFEQSTRTPRSLETPWVSSWLRDLNFATSIDMKASLVKYNQKSWLGFIVPGFRISFSCTPYKVGNGVKIVHDPFLTMN